MTDAERTAAENMRRVLALVPCACKRATDYNYDGKGERVCMTHQAMAQWDESKSKTNENNNATGHPAHN